MVKKSKFVSPAQRKAVMASYHGNKRQVLTPQLKRDLKKTARTYKKPIVLQSNLKGYRVVNKEHRNIKQDKRLSALPPGKRISKNGNIYYEYRSNRSDLNQKTRL
jgi:hypothetical protein